MLVLEGSDGGGEEASMGEGLGPGGAVQGFRVHEAEVAVLAGVLRSNMHVVSSAVAQAWGKHPTMPL